MLLQSFLLPQSHVPPCRGLRGKDLSAMLQQKLLPAALSHRLTQHTFQDAAADMHVIGAGKLTMAIPRKSGILTSMRLSKAQHGGKLPGKEPGAGQEVELRSGYGSGHHAERGDIPPISGR